MPPAVASDPNVDRQGRERGRRNWRGQFLDKTQAIGRGCAYSAMTRIVKITPRPGSHTLRLQSWGSSTAQQQRCARKQATGNDHALPCQTSSQNQMAGRAKRSEQCH
jgi:hypothetical protein